MKVLKITLGFILLSGVANASMTMEQWNEYVMTEGKVLASEKETSSSVGAWRLLMQTDEGLVDCAVFFKSRNVACRPSVFKY